MLSPVRPYVRLSVTRMDQSKTVEVTIMKFFTIRQSCPSSFCGPEWGRQTVDGCEKQAISSFKPQQAYLENGTRYVQSY